MAAKKTRGRKTLLTPETVETITRYLKDGGYVDHACTAVGIGKSTYYSWLERGRKEADRRAAGLEPDENETQYLEFMDTVEKAQAEAAVSLIGEIANHARNGTWQAAAWILERKFPRQWGRFDRAEVSGPEGGAVKIDVSSEELERKVKRILEKRSKS